MCLRQPAPFPAERNYNMGNCGLLPVMMALSECCCLLEWAFLVRTDHRNLSYLQTANHLNCQQARQARFIGRFAFTLTTQDPEPVLSLTCVVKALAWHVEEWVQEVVRATTDPGRAPPNTLFVPDSNTMALTIVDRFSWSIWYIVSDRGPQFTSRKAFCMALGALMSLSPGHHPQANAETERMNQTLLWCMAARHPTAWSTFLPWVEYS